MEEKSSFVLERLTKIQWKVSHIKYCLFKCHDFMNALYNNMVTRLLTELTCLEELDGT